VPHANIPNIGWINHRQVRCTFYSGVGYAKKTIVILGVGSTYFTRGIVESLITKGGEWDVRLVDIDPECLEIATLLSKRLVEAYDAPVEISGSVDRTDVLSGADAVVSTIGVGGRRAWYEGCDFVIPRFYKSHVLPRLKAEADLVHEYGANFGYICSSDTKPMLDFYPQAGFDVLLGLDPIQGTHTDMPLMKQKLGEKICLWGGVSAAVTVERGSEAEIRTAVREAHKILRPRGFILSPIDNLTVDEPQTWENIDIFIDEWKLRR
jgi:hypothetical protein